MKEEFVPVDSDDTVPFLPESSLPRLKKWIILARSAVMGVLIIILVVISVKCYHQDTNTITSKVCLTKECILASASILSKMDQDIDPCVDMYSYACGRWLKNTEVPYPNKEWNPKKDLEANVHKTFKKILKTGDHALQGKNSTAIEKLKKIYQQCMDEEGIKNGFFTIFSQWGSKLGPRTYTSYNITLWDNQTWSLQTSIELMHMLNMSGLFTMNVTEDTDDNGKSNYILQFHYSGLTIDNDTSEEKMEAFKRFGSFFVMYLPLGLGLTKTEMRKVISFEKQLAQIVIDSETEGGREYIQLDDLQELFSPWLNISHYLTARFNGAELPSGINVSIITPGYFHKLKDLINETEKEDLAKYMMWNFFNSISDALPEYMLNYEKKKFLFKDSPPRYEMCINKITEVLDLALIALYADSNFQLNSLSRSKVTKTVQEINNEIVATLKNLKWLDYRTRNHLQKKSETLKYNIGYPDWIMDVNKLDEFYEELKVDSDLYVNNYLNISRYLSSKNLKLLQKPSDEEQWIRSPIAGAPFSFNRTIYITTGYTQPPFYDPTFPVPFHYGRIGFLAALAILHNFDMDDSWLKFTKDKYFDRAKCFQDQYSKYIVQRQPMNSTLDEYIFDTGALRHTYQVYKKNNHGPLKVFPSLNLTEDQLFFLGFSQSMCSVYSQPNDAVVNDLSSNEMYRVIGSLSNSVDFAKAFNCPLNSPMNPENKCQIW